MEVQRCSAVTVAASMLLLACQQAPERTEALSSMAWCISPFTQSRRLLHLQRRQGIFHNTRLFAAEDASETEQPVEEGWNKMARIQYYRQHDIVAEPSPMHQLAAKQTWNWCELFVVPLNLCPWAASSVRTNQAIRLHVMLADDLLVEDVESVVRSAAEQLHHDLQSAADSSTANDPTTAIAFVVVTFEDTTSSPSWGFGSFYNWFGELEEAYLDEADEDEDAIGNFVTLAPFHPDWTFNNDDESLNFEKRSPYPTISIVSSVAIDAAGPEATKRIGEHNARVLWELRDTIRGIHKKNILEQ